MEETFKKWVSLGQDSEAIAKALYQASDGKVTRLNDRDWNNKESVWERALQILFPGSPSTSTDRYFLWAIWIQERKKVAENYEKLRGKRFQRSQKSQQDAGSVTSHCFCQRSYKLLKNVPMIQCGSCLAWYHGVCAFVDPMDFKGNKPFECAVCEGKIKIPPIFMETPSSSPAVSDASKATPKISGISTQPDVQVPVSDALVPSKDTIRGRARFSGLFRGNASRPGKKLFKEDDDEDEVSSKEDDNLGDDGNISDIDHRHVSDKSSREGSLEVIDEVNNSLVLDEEIEEESRRQNEECVKTPMSKQFTSTMSLNINNDEEDNFKIKNPTSPMKKDVSTPIKNDDEDASSSDDQSEHEIRPSDNESQNEDDEKESCPDDNTIDTSKIPLEFEAYLDYDQWRSFIRTKQDDQKEASKLKGKSAQTYVYEKNLRIDKEYSNVFSKVFDRFNRVCIIGFYNKKFKPHAPKAPFLRAYGECTKAPRKCPAKYTFIIQETPAVNVNKDVLLKISLISEEGPAHEYGHVGDRRHHGNVLKEVREQLKHKKAAAVRSKLILRADEEALSTGKLNEAKNLNALRQSKFKQNKATDLDDDELLDVLATRAKLKKDYPDIKCSGYIQQVSDYRIIHTRVIMYSKLQFEVFNKTTKRFGPRVLQLDATGQLTRGFPAPYDTGIVLLHTMIIRSPCLGTQVLPIGEMLSTDGTATSIAYFLKRVLESYRNACNVKLPYYGIGRIEIDFSKATLAAIVNVFTGITVSEYLENIWNLMADVSLDATKTFAIHICRFHITRALESYVKSGVGINPNSDSKILVTKWIYRLTHAVDLWAFHRLCRDAAFIFGQMYVTQSLLDCMDEIDEPTPREGTPPWSDFNARNATRLDIQFYLRSPFGAYAEEIFDQMDDRNQRLQSSGRNYQLNPCYDPEFLRTLKLHYLPYFPIISYGILNVLNVDTNDDTTNAIEQYHGLLKTNIYQKELRQKIPRFLRNQSDFIRASCFTQIAALASFPRHRPKQSGLKKTTFNAPGARKNGDDEGSQNSPHQSGKNSQSQPSGVSSKPLADELNKTGNKIKGLWDSNDDGLLSEKGQRSPNKSQTGRAQRKSSEYPFDKESISPESQKEVWKSKLKTQSQETVLDNFNVPLIKWGGKINIDNSEFSLGNSCSMDTTLQILLAMYYKVPEFKTFLDNSATELDHENNILEVITYLRKNNINAAKSTWLRGVLCKSDEQIMDNILHSEDEYGWAALKHWFPTKKLLNCSNESCVGHDDSNFWEHEIGTLFDLRPFSVDHFLMMCNRDFSGCTPCPSCKENLRARITFEFENMPFIAYAINENGKRKSLESEMRFTQNIKDVNYSVFAYTILINEGTPMAHYLVKFVNNYKKMVYNGLDEVPKLELSSTNEIVTSVWLLRSP